jgi:hypothetical protein
MRKRIAALAVGVLALVSVPAVIPQVAPEAQASSAGAYYCYRGSTVRFTWQWYIAAGWVLQGFHCDYR